MTDDDFARITTQRDIAIIHRNQLKVELVHTSAHIRSLEKTLARAEAKALDRAQLLVMGVQLSLADSKATLKTAVQLAYASADARDRKLIEKAFGQMVHHNDTGSTVRGETVEVGTETAILQQPLADGQLEQAKSPIFEE